MRMSALCIIYFMRDVKFLQITNIMYQKVKELVK